MLICVGPVRRPPLLVVVKREEAEEIRHLPALALLVLPSFSQPSTP
jgi:hypothetical protein